MKGGSSAKVTMHIFVLLLHTHIYSPCTNIVSLLQMCASTFTHNFCFTSVHHVLAGLGGLGA